MTAESTVTADAKLVNSFVAPGHPIVVALSIMTSFEASDLRAYHGLTEKLFSDVFRDPGVIGYRGIVEPVVRLLMDGLDRQCNDDTMVEHLYRLWHDLESSGQLMEILGLGRNAADFSSKNAPKLAQEQVTAFRNVWNQWRIET